jgi:hypothetical protein
VLPYYLTVFHPYNTGFTGDISDHINWFGQRITIYDLQDLQVTGDLTHWRFGEYPKLGDIHFERTLVTGNVTNWTFEPTINFGSAKIWIHETLLTGDITNWILPERMNLLYIFDSDIDLNIENFQMPAGLGGLSASFSEGVTPTVTGSLTGFTFPTIPTDAYVVSLGLSGHGLTGDMRTSLIPAYTKGIQLDFGQNDITHLPRGEFRWVNIFDFAANNCDSGEIDAFLSYVDSYFVGGVVPLTSATYTINGTGMGIPSAAGLASKSSIESKYTAAGFTATITVNS